MTQPVALGIDVGTTRVKVATVDLDGRERRDAAARTPWRLSDQGPLLDLDELRDLVVGLCDDVARQELDQGGVVRAIAVTGIAETGALLDGAGAPVAPGFAWYHRSGDPRRVYDALGHEEFQRRTGREASISPSITKLDMLRAQGLAFEPGWRWLNIPDYVAYCLCGEQAAEVSTSSRTGLIDVVAGTWWDEALAFLGVDRSFLPGEPVPGGTVLGPVRRDLPESLRDATVATGGHDHPVAAMGVGMSEPGTLCLSLGTAEAQLRFCEPLADRADVAAIVAAGGFVDWHPLGDRLTVLAAAPTGVTMERLARLLGRADVAARLALSESAVGRQGPPATRARLVEATFDGFDLVGVDDAADPVEIWRMAVAELVRESTALADSIETVLGPRTATVAYGGWIHDPLVREARWGGRSDSRPTQVSLANVDEPGIVGAALIAARGVGLISSLPRPALEPLEPPR